MEKRKLIDSRYHNQIEESFNIKFLNAKNFITSERLDIAIKYRLAKCILSGMNDKRASYLYYEHINILSNKTFIEPGDSTKKTYQDYFEAYRLLILDIAENGFDPTKSVIPLSKNGIPLDGAHRIAAAAALGIMVPTLMLNADDLVYDVDYFKSRYTSGKLVDEFFLNYIEYTDEEVSLVIEWPLNLQLDKRINEVYDQSIVYKKNIMLNYNAIKNIMLVSYWGEGWLGGYKLNNIGIHNKVKECYKEGVATKFYWIKNIDLENRIKRKETIRLSTNSSKHSIHSTDSRSECVALTKSLLHSDSCSQLNVIEPERFSKSLGRLVSHADVLVNPSIMIVGSSLLSIYGIREANDIDSLYDGNIEEVSIDNVDFIGSHNNYLSIYGFDSISDIYDPNNFIYYFGIKFISVDILLRFKENRGEFKDKEDVLLLESILGSRNISVAYHLRKYYYGFMQEMLFFVIRLIKFFRLKGVVKKILKVFGK